MMFWYGHNMSGWGYAWMSIGTVLFWALLIAGVVLLVKYATATDSRQPPAPPGPPPFGPEQLLAERFARGEIDRDEYLDRLNTLRGPGATPPQ